MSIEVLQGLQRKATFSVNKNEVQAESKVELKKYAKDAKVQGFRPGKAPAHVIEKMYGGKAYEEALNKQLNQQFVDLIVENKIDLVGYPKFDLTNSEGDNFVFAASFEVMPEIKLNSLSNIEIEKPECNISAENIEKTIEVLRQQRAKFNDVNKIAENSDYVTIDFVGTVDGEEFAGGKAEEYPFILGQGTMLPEFEAGVLGLKLGETKSVEVTFPDNYHAEHLRSKKAVFNITLKNVAQQELPELNEDFIKTLGVKDGQEATLRQEIKDNLHHEINRRLHITLRDNVLNALQKENAIDVPSALVHDEIHNMMHRTKEKMKQQGYKQEQVKLTHEMFELDAKRMVTLRLLIQQFIKDSSISITDDEIKQVIADMAVLYDDPEQYIKWYNEDQNRVANAKAIAMENKVIDAILATAKTKNVTVDYEELMKRSI